MKAREQDLGPEPIGVETFQGEVLVRATGGNQIRIEIRGMAPLVVRGVEIYGSVFVSRNDDGSWADQYESIDRVDRRDVSHALKITMREVFQEAARKFYDEHPDLLHQGALREVNNELYHKEKEARSLRDKLRDLEQDIEDLIRIEEGLQTVEQPTVGPRP